MKDSPTEYAVFDMTINAKPSQMKPGATKYSRLVLATVTR